MKTRKSCETNLFIRFMMIVPVIAGLLFFTPGCSQNSKSSDAGTEIAPPPPPPPPPVADTGSDQPYQVVDEMPVFKGGDAAILKYIAENTKYPEAAKTGGIQGKVIVRFAIESDGSVGRVAILKGVDPELDNEALRVVNGLPSFEKPGIKDGKPVAVWYMVPINFALK
jgi:protein TonB